MSQRDVKNRIASVQNIRTITRAMEMVAAARLRRAEQRIEHLRPYAGAIRRMTRQAAEAAGGEMASLPILREHEKVERVALLLVTGLPIMSLMQFLGGIDPELMLAGYACIALTMIGIGSLSILFSTLFKRSRDAISLTYLLLLSYAAIAMTGYMLSFSPVAFMSFPLWFNDDPPTLRSLSHLLNAGNPIAMVINVVSRPMINSAMLTIASVIHRRGSGLSLGRTISSRDDCEGGESSTTSSSTMSVLCISMTR